MIDRRDALKRMAALTGGALSLSTAAGVLNGCRSAPGDGASFETLSGPQAELVGALVDRILPPTDTPGARAVGVPAFVDRLLTDWMTQVERTHFLGGLQQVDPMARRRFDAPFADCSGEEQDAVLRALAAEAADRDEQVVTIDVDAAWDGAVLPAPIPGTGRPETMEIRLQPFFFHLKELTLVGYYTSEVGATEELRYEHVPGRHEGCLPVEELGRAWA
jgi:hypothetical protein